MAIGARLRRLERAIGVTDESEDACPLCSTKRFTVSFACDPELGPCEACGREPTVWYLRCLQRMIQRRKGDSLA